MTQPTALYLADVLEHAGTPADLAGPIAAELRRLHKENERLTLNGIHSCHQECQRPVCRLTRERNALLEALKAIEPILARMYGPQAADLPPMQIVRAAIKQAEENT